MHILQHYFASFPQPQWIFSKNSIDTNIFWPQKQTVFWHGKTDYYFLNWTSCLHQHPSWWHHCAPFLYYTVWYLHLTQPWTETKKSAKAYFDTLWRSVKILVMIMNLFWHDHDHHKTYDRCDMKMSHWRFWQFLSKRIA